MRFRCCLKHRVLHYSPETACKIINACVILHNMCMEYNIPEPEPEVDEAVLEMNIEGVIDEDNMNRVNVELGEGRAARRLIIDRYFR